MKKSLIIHPEELSTKWIDKISELGCDCIGIHSVGGAHSKASLERLIDMSDNDDYKKLIGFFGTKDSKILEYWYDNSLFSDYKKPPKELKANNELIHKDFEFYKSFGVEFVASFACYLGDDYRALYGEPDLSAFELL